MFVGDSLASCLAIYAWHSADWSSIDADWTISPFLLYLSNNYPIKCHLPNHIYMHLHPCCSNHIHSYASTIFLLVDPFLRYLDPDFSIGLHLNSTFLFFSAKKWFQGVRPRQMGRLGMGMRLWGWWLVTGESGSPSALNSAKWTPEPHAKGGSMLCIWPPMTQWV